VTLAVERGHADVAREVAHLRRDRRGRARYRRGRGHDRGPLDERLRASITDKLAAALGRPVTLRERVDASIVGGVIIKVARSRARREPGVPARFRAHEPV
jgi:hypothetical protein